MGPLKDENKLQVDEKNNKNWKFKKSLKMYDITNFKTIRYKMTALIHESSMTSFWDRSDFYTYLKILNK